VNFLAKGAAVYFISNIFNALAPLILLPYLTRTITPSELGEITMFQTFVLGLGAFVGLSVHGAAARKYFDKEVTSDELSSYVGACIQILIVTFFLTFLVGLMFISQLSELLSIRESWVLVAISASFFSFIIQLRLSQWQIRHKSHSYGFIQVGLSVSDLLLSVVLISYVSLNYEGRVISIFSVYLLFATISLYSLSKDRLINIKSFCWIRIKEILDFGVPLIPHVIGAFFLVAADRFIINLRLGLDDAAFYMVAVQFSLALKLVFDASNKVYSPWLFSKLANNDFSDKLLIVKYSYMFAIFAILIGLAYGSVGPFFIGLVAGSDYIKAADAFLFICLGQSFNGLYLMVTNYIFYTKNTKRLSFITIFVGMLNIVLLWFLIPSYGLLSAGIAFLCSNVLRFILTWYFAKVEINMPWFYFIKTTKVR